MEIKLFLSEGCPLCPEALAACEGLDDLSVFDIERVEGRSEAVAHGVRTAPSILVLDNDGREIAAWRGEVPDKDSLRSLLVN